ncbi:YgiT-type zinc finger protein [Streptacidiphilus sp. PB12-B1b]|uniref:YgiT-type zinc finger protein n=1 Tax=Streptacidiphilus sp. PB12-B1b TaxID=2705012 RepID=UPI0015F8D55F|nr:YgiT-type zinc finger protein [Streptacidiphilus sp. PB12-B1b]QMU79691.1 YgiT-type zinc finger protein [Streptacidiphilus sp. PB12-B1b]
MGDTQCPSCGGTGLTEKVEYTYELDADGSSVAVRHAYISQCTACGGLGRV